MKCKFLSFSILLCTLLCMAALPCFAGEAPRKIAIVPTVSQSRGDFPDVKQYCDDELYRQLRIPLNGVLKIYEYIERDKIIAVLPELSATGKLHKFTASRLKEAADLLDADLIVGFIITDIGETRHTSWSGDIILYSYVNIDLIGYDRQKGVFINHRDRDYFHGEESAEGHVINLVKETADRLLKKADLHKNVFPLNKNSDA